MPMGGASVSTCRDPRTSSPHRPRRKGTTGHPAGSGLDTLVRTARGLASSPRVTPQTTPSRLAYITGRCTHVLTVQSTPQLVALSGGGGMRPGFDCLRPGHSYSRTIQKITDSVKEEVVQNDFKIRDGSASPPAEKPRESLTRFDIALALPAATMFRWSVRSCHFWQRPAIDHLKPRPLSSSSSPFHIPHIFSHNPQFTNSHSS